MVVKPKQGKKAPFVFLRQIQSFVVPHKQNKYMKYQFTPRSSRFKEKFIIFVAFLQKLNITEIVQIVLKTLILQK